jgi:hypothetical protein
MTRTRRSGWRAQAWLAVAALLALALATTSGLATANVEARGMPPRPTPTASPSPTPTPPPAAPAEVSVLGAWHCSDDYCTWGRVRDVVEFDAMNHWLVDRDPSPAVGPPSVNLVVLSFVNPLILQTRVAVQGGAVVGDPVAGIPVGMTREIVEYFTGHGVRVMLSIGGITYTDDWNAALAMGGRDLGLKAAAVAEVLGVGIEIDYEENTDPNLVELEEFIRAYRSVHAFDPAAAAMPRRLTIDIAAGDRWLIALNRKATADWLRGTDHPLGQDPAIALDWANAMVPARQPSADKAIASWQEHVDGKPQYAPPVPPLAPAKFTGGLYLAEGSSVRPECTDCASSLLAATESYVRAVPPNGAGTTAGMLGWMLWAAEKPSTRGVGTQPPNGCEGGMGVAASKFEIPIPMTVLRQE